MEHVMSSFFMKLFGIKPLEFSVYLDKKTKTSVSKEEIVEEDDDYQRKALALANDIKMCENDQKKLATIFDNMPQAIYVSSFDTYEILYANPALEEHHGDVTGQTCYKALHGFDSPCPFCTNKYIQNGQPTYKWEFFNERLNKTLDITDSMIDWPGRGKARLEVATDITELVQTMKDLRKKQIEARELAEASECSIIFHRNDEVLLINSAFTKLTGYTKEDLIGSGSLVNKLFVKEDRDRVKQKVDNGREEKYVATLVHKNGKEILAHIKSRPRNWNGDEQKARVAVIIAHEYVERLVKDA